MPGACHSKTQDARQKDRECTHLHLGLVSLGESSTEHPQQLLTVSLRKLLRSLFSAGGLQRQQRLPDLQNKPVSEPSQGLTFQGRNPKPCLCCTY